MRRRHVPGARLLCDCGSSTCWGCIGTRAEQMMLLPGKAPSRVTWRPASPCSGLNYSWCLGCSLTGGCRVGSAGARFACSDRFLAVVRRGHKHMVRAFVAKMVRSGGVVSAGGRLDTDCTVQSKVYHNGGLANRRGRCDCIVRASTIALSNNTRQQQTGGKTRLSAVKADREQAGGE